MTERVHPTQGEASSQLTSGAIKWAAATDWIVPNGTDYLAAFAGLSGTPLNGFDESHTSTSFDVTIDTGEAFVGGRWMAKDTTTTVTLASSTSNQTIYAGWESSTGDSVVIGLDSAFSSTDDGRRTELYEADTDGSGVTNVDVLHVHEQIHPHAENADALGGSPESAFGKLAQNEVVTGAWNFDDIVDFSSGGATASIHVHGTNAVDSNEVIIDGDADAGQDDDLLKVRSIGDPSSGTFADSDTIFVTKGEGLTGINTYSPTNPLDVNGSAIVRGDLEVRDNQLLVTRGGQQIAIRETDTNTDWLVEAQAGQFRIVEQGVEEWLEIDTGQGGRIEAPGGFASQQMRLTPRSSPPDIVQNGQMAVQDGAGWNPAGTGELDLVCYLGGVWELCSQPP